MTTQSLLDQTIPVALDIGQRVLGAIILLLVGRVVVGAATRALRRGLERRSVDPTLGRYAATSLGIALNIVLLISVLGVLGVETATFAGLLAAAGVAIGMAWSGMLGNFAAGVFLVVLRPFKVGDMISGAGVVGVVQDVSLFVTTINTPDNVKTFVPNGKLFSDTIQNYDGNSVRRVDLAVQLDHTADVAKAIEVVRAALARVPNVAPSPTPVVEVLEVRPAGPVLAARPFTSNATYWDVYFAANREIGAALGAAGFPTPAERHVYAGAPPLGVVR